jgi:uroporphyrinogen decarboxylase
MNKRDALLRQIRGENPPGFIPAAFFMHFDSTCHQGQAAIDKHMEFFHYTGMDFVKIQFEQTVPSPRPIRQPKDWAHAPLCPEEFFETTVRVVKGLVKAAKDEALVILTLYSPFMWAKRLAGEAVLGDHLRQNPEAVKKGLEITTENVLNLVSACQRVGVDGFYASSQGGEAFRFRDTDIFEKHIKPTDLAVWDRIQSCAFNILHICDYEGDYDDLNPFLDYPGHVVNCSLKLGERTLSPKAVSRMFRRPFMGGMERKGVIATGNLDDILRAAESILADAPERFILAADCTVPNDTPWDHLKIAIDAAHRQRP